MANEMIFSLNEKLANDTMKVGEMALSTLLLMNDAQYPWFVLVPRVVGITELYQLSPTQQQQFLQESNQLSTWLMAHFKGDKLNVAALGNVCPQLHIHHIVRYKDDLAWPRPIWGVAPHQPYDKNKAELILLAAREALIS